MLKTHLRGFKITKVLVKEMILYQGGVTGDLKTFFCISILFLLRYTPKQTVWGGASRELKKEFAFVWRSYDCGSALE
jgi:hypothetical protein